jgi:hypothetical protein
VFSVATNSYSILAEPAGSPGRGSAVGLTDPATGRPFTVVLSASSPGIALTGVSLGAGSEVGFDWRGRPLDATGADLSGAGVVTITGGRTVSVRPGSGLATVP